MTTFFSSSHYHTAVAIWDWSQPFIDWSCTILSKWGQDYYDWISVKSRFSALAILAVVFAVSVGVMFILRSIYPREGLRRPPILAYIVMVASALATLPHIFNATQCIALGGWGLVLHTAMTFSTGWLMVYSAWIIRCCGTGFDEEHLESNHPYSSFNFNLGKVFGFLLWTGFVVANWKVFWAIFDRLPLLPFSDDWILLWIPGMFVFYLFGLKGLLPFLRVFFVTANTTILFGISCVFDYAFCKYLYLSCDANLTSICFILGVIFIVGFGFVAYTIGFVHDNAMRCSYCHSYDSDCEGTDNLGIFSRESYSTRTKDLAWNAGFVDRFSISRIRTTNLFRAYSDTYRCNRCNHFWEIGRENFIGGFETVTDYKEYQRVKYD